MLAWLIWLVLIMVVLFFGFVLLRGAPYLPSLNRHIEAALDLLNLAPGQTVYDLGCGDGRFLKAAARRGLKAVGYELNPIMFAYSWLTTRRRKNIRVYFGDFWNAELTDADAVYVFLLDKFMPKLDDKLKSSGKHLKLASHTFIIPGKSSAAHKNGVYLYEY
jgi:SAM-dependent methyltransferase